MKAARRPLGQKHEAPVGGRLRAAGVTFWM
jgi:hypothetical protein